MKYIKYSTDIQMRVNDNNKKIENHVYISCSIFNFFKIIIIFVNNLIFFWYP